MMSDEELVETENRITQDMRERWSNRPEKKQNEDRGMRRRREYKHEREGAGAERKGSHGAGGGLDLKCTGQYISDGSEGD